MGEHEIEMPNVTDVRTLAALAKMASNAYIQDDNSGWWDLEGRRNVVSLGLER
jgi:putative lipase involved disintegration of autophagic bodies